MIKEGGEDGRGRVDKAGTRRGVRRKQASGREVERQAARSREQTYREGVRVGSGRVLEDAGPRAGDLEVMMRSVVRRRDGQEGEVGSGRCWRGRRKAREFGQVSGRSHG